MSDEFAFPDLVEIIRSEEPEFLRASIKRSREHAFSASGKNLPIEVSVHNYDLDIRAFEPDGLKTLEISISPALMARIIRDYGKALAESGIPFPFDELHNAFMKAHTAIVNAPKPKVG